MFKMRFGLFQRLDAAVNGHRQVREVTLQLIHARIVQRRDLTVLFRAQAGEPGFSRVDDEHLAFALAGDRIDEIAQEFVAVLVVNPDTGFDRHRNGNDVAHRLDTVRHQLRVPHQAGAEHAVLHAIGRAANVEVDLVVAARFSQLRALRQGGRIAAAQLQGNRMLFFAIGQIVALAVNDCACGHHFGVQQRMAGELAQEIAAVSVRPVEHRRNGKTVCRESGL